MTTRRAPSRLLLLSTLTLVLFLPHLPHASARSWTSAELPNPQNDPGGICGRKNRSSVCDPDGYLSESDADEIQGLANFINEGTHGFKRLPCPGGTSGPQIAVAVVDQMSAARGDKKERAFQFARDLHDRWGVGDVACQNGVVLFFAVKDRAMGFSTGAGIKPVFTDSMIPSVMSSIAPLLREKQYGQAIVAAVTAIGNVLAGGKPPEAADSGFDWVSVLFVSGFASAAIASGMAGQRSRRRYRDCRSVLRRIDDQRRQASSNNYVCTSCPICLEDFEDGGDGAPDAPSGSGRNGSAVVSTTRTGAAMATTQRGAAGRTASPDTAKQATAAEERDVEAQPLSTGFGATTARQARADGDDAAATTTEGAQFAEDSQQTVTLLCGHKFHEACIATWLSGPRSNSQTCPICRQPVRAAASEQTLQTTARTVEPRTNAGMPSGWDVYDPEYSFRMQRAHYFYPDYITWSMMNSWHDNRHQRTPMESAPAFVAVDPVVVAQAARASGSGGSSFSFGGGSSAGGGGGGGGW